MNPKHFPRTLKNHSSIFLPRYNPSDMSWGCGIAASPQLQSNNLDLDSHQDAAHLLQEVVRGLKTHVPELIQEGEGGSYFIRNNSGRLLAVFKPADEDPYSPRNPKLDGRAPLEVQRGVLPGEAPVREVAAYLLDHQHFAGVPLTLRARLNHPLFRGPVDGSIQHYQQHDLASWDIGPGAFEKADVQRIALLDLRLLNTDRHGGNILVRRVDLGRGSHKYKLIPIDHGMCLPDPTVKYDELYFEWENWPQSKAAFEATAVRYVREIDIWADVQIVRALGVREECIRMFVVTSTLVKVTVARGFSPAAIAQLMRRAGKEMKMEEVLPSISNPAAISSLLFRMSAWVDSTFPGKRKVGPDWWKDIYEEGEIIPGRSLAGMKQTAFHRQNSAPILYLPDGCVQRCS